MSIFTRTTGPAPQAELDERPELWIPDHLREEFDAIARERLSSITQYTHPRWLAELAGSDAMGLDGKPVGLIPLIPDQKPKWAWSKSPAVRTCLLCWHEAVDLTRANRATLPDGRKRADIVAAYLAGANK